MSGTQVSGSEVTTAGRNTSGSPALVPTGSDVVSTEASQFQRPNSGMIPSPDGHYKVIVHIGPCSMDDALEFSEKVTDAAFDGDYGPNRGHVVTVTLGHHLPSVGGSAEEPPE